MLSGCDNFSKCDWNSGSVPLAFMSGSVLVLGSYGSLAMVSVGFQQIDHWMVRRIENPFHSCELLGASRIEVEENHPSSHK